MFGRDRSDRGAERLTRRNGTGSRFVSLLAVIGAVVVVLLFLRSDLFDLPDWFSGGKSDPAPHGTVTYKGQEATAASEDFLIDIGDGEATVSVKAKQNWDKPGNIISGDFQSTNGTSSVADPKDRDEPAALKVKIDYCSDGLITTYTPVNPDKGGPDKQVRFQMGHLYVCNTTLEHSIQNDAAFKQDDTPNIFQGEFVTFVARAVEWTAAAAACPTKELAKFQSDEFLAHVRTQLAQQLGLPTSAVEVVEGTPGKSNRETQRSLRRRLEGYANAEDPDHPSKTYDALDIQFLSTDEEAVKDSCYRDPGRRQLEDLESVTPPTTTTTTTSGD
jgi:hypothetical protein